MTTGRTITIALHRVQNGHRKRFAPAPTVRAAPDRRPARVAVMLALAHKIRAAIDGGAVPDQAEVARRLRITRARVTQLLVLLALSPDLQERVLDLEAVNGAQPLTERSLRKVTRLRPWTEQRLVFDAQLLPNMQGPRMADAFS